MGGSVSGQSKWKAFHDDLAKHLILDAVYPSFLHNNSVILCITYSFLALKASANSRTLLKEAKSSVMTSTRALL